MLMGRIISKGNGRLIASLISTVYYSREYVMTLRFLGEDFGSDADLGAAVVGIDGY